jgi:hypothetical protein
MARHLGQIRHIPKPARATASPAVGLAKEGAPPRAPLPLGDLVERFARPIAAFLDRALGTHLTGCPACSRRRQYLNHLVPDIRSPLAWLTALSRLRGPSPSGPSRP